MIAQGTAAAQQMSGKTQPPSPALLHIRDLIYSAAGIFQNDSKLYLLQQRCERRMRVLGVATLREYYQCLTLRPMRHAELISLLNEITVGETCFFRNPSQVAAIRKVVLPHIIAAKTKLNLQRIRIWSAGCSTGEEPYTLAMVLLEEAQQQLKGWEIEVHATDINERSLAHAQEGLYGEYSLRNAEPAFLARYFDVQGDKYSIRQEVKAVVRFSRVNLVDEEHMSSIRAMDLIVCCNVLIYFDAASKAGVIQRFSNALLTHGYLMLGHAESLYGITTDFQLVHLPSATAYIKSQQAKSTGGEP